MTGPVDRAPEVPFSATSLVDLVTGEVRAVGAGRPVGWAPDGRLLVRTRHDALDLVDVDTGRAARLVGYVNPIAFGRTAPRWPSRATTPSRSSACRTARSAAR